MNDTTWFWEIVDARGLADVSSDEFVALNELISKAERATTAESERDELLREKERLGDELAAAMDVLRTIHNCGQSAEPDHWKFRCMARDIAKSALENGPAGLADANSKSPDPSSQSERIAVLEAALREKDRVVQLYGKHDKLTDLEKIGAIINHPCFAAALAPLGEE